MPCLKLKLLTWSALDYTSAIVLFLQSPWYQSIINAGSTRRLASFTLINMISVKISIIHLISFCKYLGWHVVPILVHQALSQRSLLRPSCAILLRIWSLTVLDHEIPWDSNSTAFQPLFIYSQFNNPSISSRSCSNPCKCLQISFHPSLSGSGVLPRVTPLLGFDPWVGLSQPLLE